MALFNAKFILSLRILGFDHYRFPCSCQAFAYIASRNSPFDPIHLFSRALLNSHWFCHYNENHLFHACLIIKYLMHSLWQAFQNMRLCISIQLVSFSIPMLVILISTHTHQQAPFGYKNKFLVIDTYPNLHDSHCLLMFSY